MSFETTIAAFAAALTDPTASPPSETRGRAGGPDARRFAVYRNNVAAGLIGSLEARYPVTRRLVGDAFFRAMAGAYVAQQKPRSPVLSLYGADFSDFVRGFPPARELPYLGDVAELENAWVEAYHAAEAPAPPVAAIAGVAPERLDGLRLVLHPAARALSFRSPAASLWAAHQGDGEPSPPENWAPEEVLITRPDAEVFLRVIPTGGCGFLAALALGATLGEAASALIEAGGDPGAHLVGLFAAGAVTAVA